MKHADAARFEGSILAHEGWIEGRLTLEGSRIRAVEGRALSEGANPSPPYIVPGFIDLHVHGGGGADWTSGEAGIRTFVRYHTAHGTTAIAPTTATGAVPVIERSLAAISAIANRRESGEAVVVGAHLEGPFVNPKKPGAMNVALMLEGDAELARRWAENYRIAVATVAPEIPGGRGVVEALAQTDCRVQIGHSAATPEEIDRAFQCGCSGFTHLFNAMSGVEHRAPGVAAYAMAKAQYAEIICDMVHVDPIVVRAACRAIPRLYAITDASAAGLPDGELEWGGHRIVKRGRRVTLTDGTTLAGSAITMLDAFRNLVSLGIGFEEAVAMTSTRQADYLGLKDLGRIEPGARACLIRLGASLDLEGIWVDGDSVLPGTSAAEPVAAV
jgi:N-acetylglucosamine-6-phosphate deacetylase